MALNLNTLTSSATSGDVLAEMLTTADFLEPVPLLKNLARGSNKGGDAKQGTALNQPKALPLVNGKGYLYLSGGWNTNNASIPHDSSVDILGNLTVIVKATMPVWGDPAGHQVFAAKRQAGEANGWQLHFHTGTKSLRFYRGTSASSSHSSSASIDIPFSDNSTGYLKVENTPDNGSSQSTTIFYTSTDGVTWSQLGSTITKTNFTPYSNASDILIASDANGSSMVGGLHKLQLFASTDGSNKVLDVDFTATNVRHNDTKFKCASGQTVTINQSGNDPATIIKKSVLRFDGANSGLLGFLNQTVEEFYYFIAFSILGNGGETSGRIFEISSDNGAGYELTGAIAGMGNGNSLAYFVNGAWQVAHNGIFDDANGDILHQLKITNGSQISKINNADEDTRSLSTTISSEEFAIGMQKSGLTNAAIDLEFLALFPATITDAQADRVRNYINNRNTVFDLKDGFGHYFYDPQDALVGAISTSSASWNGRIVGSDNGDANKYATQGTTEDQPVGDGYKVTFADNTDHLDFPSTTQAGWQVVGTSLGTFAYKVNDNAATELNLLGNLGHVNTRQAGDLYGTILLPDTATGNDIEDAKKLLIDRGAADAVSATVIYTWWYSRADIVEFKNVDMSNVINAQSVWDGCSSMTSFGVTDIINANNFTGAWKSCSSLTSFPSGAKLGTAAANVNFTSAWQSSGLTSFPALDLSKGTNFSQTWRDNNLTSFPLIDTSSGTRFSSTWNGNDLTSFPLIDTSSGTNFSNAWKGNDLTSFPLIDTSSGTRFDYAWYDNNLTSFPLIDTSSVTNFAGAWQDNNLTSFPLIDTSSGTNFSKAWKGNDLTSFPANFFDLWNPASISSNVFHLTWVGCTALTAQSVENILVSIDASGKFGTSTGASGGGAIDIGIDIDYNVATGSLSAATNSAITSLIGKGWQVYINNVLTIPNVLALAPAAAYSLRSFDADLDPNVVNVRRSSDNATSNFKASEVSDGTLVAFVGAGNDGHVTTWYDQSSNTRNSTQMFASEQPKIVESGTLVSEGGLAGINFHTETSYLFLNHAAIHGQATLDSYYVTKATGTKYIYPSLVTSSTAYGMIANAGSSSGTSLNYGSPNYYANSTQVTGTTRGDIYTATSGTQKLVVHQGANTTNSAWGVSNMNFGNYNNDSNFGYTGKLQEMIFFNTDQSANRTGIEKNINDTYTIY